MREGNLVEYDPPLWLLELARIRCVGNFRLHVQKAVQLFKVHRALFDFPPCPAKNIQRRIKAQQHHHHGGEVTDLHRALLVVPGRQREHGQQPSIHHESLDTIEQVHAANRLNIALVVALHRAIIPKRLALFGGKRLHGFEVRQRVDGNGAQLCVRLVHPPPLAHAPLCNHHGRDDVDDDCNHCDQRQTIIVSDTERNRRQRQPDECRPDIEGQEPDQVVNRAGTALDDAIERAGPPRLMKAERERLRVPKSVHARDSLRILADRTEQCISRLRQRRCKKAQADSQCDPQDGNRERRRASPFSRNLVDRIAENDRRDHFKNRSRQREYDCDKHDWPPF